MVKKVDGAIQIPIEGHHFKGMNICICLNIKHICLNFHPIDEDAREDEKYFLSLTDAKYLRDELVDAIKIVEGE